MSERLDQLLAQLAAAPTDRALAHLDAQVRRRVAGQIVEARTAAALAPVRVASIGLALAIGVTAGSVTAAFTPAAPRSSNVFMAAADLAPSTLLDGGQ